VTILYSILDEIDPKVFDKIRGQERYEARKARIGARLTKAKRTRSSDICPRRFGEAIKPNHHLRMLGREDIFPIIRKKQK